MALLALCLALGGMAHAASLPGTPGPVPQSSSYAAASPLDAVLEGGVAESLCGVGCQAGVCDPGRGTDYDASVECTRCFPLTHTCAAGLSCGSMCAEDGDCDQLGACTICIMGMCMIPTLRGAPDVTRTLSELQRGPEFRWEVQFPVDEGGTGDLLALPDSSLRLVTSGSLADAAQVTGVDHVGRARFVVTARAEFTTQGTIRLDFIDWDSVGGTSKPVGSRYVADNTTGESYQVDPSLTTASSLAFAGGSGDASVAESAGAVALTLTQAGTSASEVCHPVALSGTAGFVADYTVPSGAAGATMEVCVPAGALSASATIELVDDAFVEPAETVIAAAGDATATLTIESDGADVVVLELSGLAFDAPAVVEHWTEDMRGLFATQSVQAHYTTCYVVSLGGDAVDEVDYEVVSGEPAEGGGWEVCIPAGMRTMLVLMVRGIEDALAEGDEKIIASSGAASATVFIEDDDDEDRTIDAFAFGSASVVEGDSVNLQVTQSASAPYQDCHVLDYGGDATVDTDFSASPFVCVAASQSTAVISVNTHEDATYEGDETISVASGAASGSIVLADNDPAPALTAFVADASEIAEVGGEATLTGTQSSTAIVPVCHALAYSGSAVHGSDYAAPDALCIAAGETSANVALQALDDAQHEGTEAIVADSAAGSVAIDILDDDPPVAATFTVNSLADPGDGTCDDSECTLREALQAAAAGSTVDFDPGLSGTIVLASQLELAADVIIDGPGAEVISVSGDDASRVFRITAPNVELRGLTVRNGYPGYATGGAIDVDSTGTFLMDGVRIIDSATDFVGGGLYILGGAHATVRNSEIAGNAAVAVGGMYFSGGATGDLVLENTTISGNTSDQQAAGLQVRIGTGRTATLRHVTVAHNPRMGMQILGSSAYGYGRTSIDASLLVRSGSNDLSYDSFVSEGGVVEVYNSVVESTYHVFDPGWNSLRWVEVPIAPLDFVDGSATRVHAIGAGAARDHVDNAIGDGSCGTDIQVDQRGAVRPLGARCDAGAFEAPAPGVLATWDFEELAPGQVLADGSRIADSSGAQRDARVGDGSELPDVVPGYAGLGAALAFAASADRVVFEPGHAFGDGGPAAGAALGLGAGDSFTVEAVVRLPAGSPQVASLVEQGDGAGSPTWWLRVDDGQLTAALDDGDAQAVANGTIGINDGEWHRVALVRDATVGSLSLYVDQMLDARVTDETQAGPGLGVVLGASPSGSHHLEGDLDLVRVTKGALDASGFFKLPDEVDLVVSIDDEETIVAPGDELWYVVTVENRGQADASDAVVSAPLPAQFAGVDWTCDADDEGECTSSGDGAINDTVTIRAGSRVTYDVLAELIGTAFDSVTYTVSATVDPAQIERDPADNIATDVNLTVPVFADGFEPADKGDGGN